MQGPAATGVHGPQEERPSSRTAALEFAQCIRDNGVKDFPDPANGEPLVDTNRIPSADRDGGMSILNAAMQKCGGRRGEAAAGEPVKRKTWVLAGAAVLVAVAATGGVVVMSGAEQATPAAQEPPANTAKVERGKLSAMVSLDGTLTYRARSDGSPYSVINQARGTYTELPEDGDKVDCGDVLYRVDDNPVLLLCGTVPAYRDLHSGDAGERRPSAQPEPARARLRDRRRSTRRRRLHLGDGDGAREAPARQGP